RGAEARIDAWQFLDAGIDPAAGLADPGDLFDDRLALVVFQLDAELVHAGAHLLGGVAADVALALQRLERVRPQLAGRRDAGRVPAALRVADAGDHVTQPV